jgi:hypothetical protein
MPDFQFLAILDLFLLRSPIIGVGIFNVLLISTVEKPLVSTTILTHMLTVNE